MTYILVGGEGLVCPLALENNDSDRSCANRNERRVRRPRLNPAKVPGWRALRPSGIAPAALRACVECLGLTYRNCVALADWETEITGTSAARSVHRLPHYFPIGAIDAPRKTIRRAALHESGTVAPAPFESRRVLPASKALHRTSIGTTGFPLRKPATQVTDPAPHNWAAQKCVKLKPGRSPRPAVFTLSSFARRNGRWCFLPLPSGTRRDEDSVASQFGICLPPE
ncbi:unnamed protein product, partial [Iphiclides podalirius]